MFDAPGKPEWSFEGLVLAHAAAHRWHWFPDMHRDEALVFKTHDSEPGRAHCVPHVAFDNPACAPEWAPRVSIEMRALALWFALTGGLSRLTPRTIILASVRVDGAS